MSTTITTTLRRWRSVPIVLGASLALAACGGPGGVAVKDGHVYTASQVAAKCDALFGSPAHVAKELHVQAVSLLGHGNEGHLSYINCSYTDSGISDGNFGLGIGHGNVQGISTIKPRPIIVHDGNSVIWLTHDLYFHPPASVSSWLQSVAKRVAK